MKLRFLILVVLITVAAVALFLARRDGSNESVELPVAALEFEGLDDAKEKFIWDAEHFTFSLETYVGKPLSTALKENDLEKLGSFFTKDFSGTALSDSTESTITVAAASAQIRSAAAKTSVTTDQFLQWLTDRTGEGVSIEKVKMRVLKIDRQEGAADLWDLKCLLTVSGTHSSGDRVFLKQDSSVVCRFSDSDEIQAGRVIEKWTVEREEKRRSPTLMVETTQQAGLDQILLHDNWQSSDARQYTKQLAVADYDSDGFPDIALADNDRRIRLLKNKAGKFVDVTGLAGLPTELSNSAVSMLVAWIDFDNDGDPDLLIDDQLFENTSDQTFRAVKNCNLKLNYRPMGSAVADFDCDGLLDIYVLYQTRRDSDDSRSAGWVGDDSAGAPNQLWKNLGDGRFKNVTASAKVAGGWRHSFAATWLHANDDVYPDLYVANDFAKNSFFVNNGDGTFKDTSDASGTADFATSMGVTAGDLDGDGESEIYVANMYSKMGRRILAQVEQSDYPEGIYEQLLGACAGNRLYRKTGSDGVYSDFSDQLGVNAVGWAYAPAFTDFDRDGWLDIYATAGFLSFERGKPDG